MNKPRTFRVSETGGHCDLPRVHLDHFIDDLGPGGVYDEAIWDAYAEDGLGGWIFKKRDGKHFDRLLEELNALEKTETVSDEEIEINAKGGKQSAIGTRFDLIPPSAIHAVAEVLKEGADKYGIDNWRKIPSESHINHALRHIYVHLETVRMMGLEPEHSTDDLIHAAVRLLFAISVEFDGEID